MRQRIEQRHRKLTAVVENGLELPAFRSAVLRLQLRLTSHVDRPQFGGGRAVVGPHRLQLQPGLAATVRRVERRCVLDDDAFDWVVVEQANELRGAERACGVVDDFELGASGGTAPAKQEALPVAADLALGAAGTTVAPKRAEPIATDGATSESADGAVPDPAKQRQDRAEHVA